MNSIKKEGKPTETIVASTVCLKKSKKLLYITFRVVTTFILFEQILYEITWSPFAKLLYVVVIFKITLRGRHFKKLPGRKFQDYVVAIMQNYVVTSFKITLCGRHLQNYFVASSKIMWMPFLKLHCRHLKNYLVAICKITWALFTILCGRHLKNYLVAICKIHGRFL